MELTKEQKAGFKLLLTHIKRKYPFIISISVNYNDIKKYGSLMGFDIQFDLNMFYELMNINPPANYLKNPYLLDLLNDKGTYLFRYVDDDIKNKFSSEYNDRVERHINEYYKRLPDYMTIHPYDGWSDKEIEDLEKEREYNPGFIKRMFKGDSLKLSLANWIPVFDQSKYDTKES